MQFFLKSRNAFLCNSKKSVSEVTDSENLTKGDSTEQVNGPILLFDDFSSVKHIDDQ